MRSTSGVLKVLGVAMVALVAACVSPPPTPLPVTTQAPPGFPEAYYKEAAMQGIRVFRIDPAESLVVIEVRRGGSLARLGHDHVVASREVGGFVVPSAGRADLYVRFDRLIVDEPALRAEAGFDTQPTDEDVAGTRRNMLNGLEAAKFPFALVNVAGGSEGDGNAGLRVTLTLHGVTRTLQVPVWIDRSADAVTVAGRLAVKQTDFGITPLSVLGGAIQVQDEVQMRFRIRASAMNETRAAARGTAAEPGSTDITLSKSDR